MSLRNAQRERGLSQEELAHPAQVHQTYLSGVDRGKRSPTIAALDRIASVLEMDIEQLVRRRSA
ncbi:MULTISPECIES: helix-turn-helix transcriptional regulator [Methylobacterium]|uniref:helix-turn-helix domain-containing protein n=1 Tax=Methylobacterium TaxID=407 RepID=UPI001EE1CD47|nr:MULTISPECIES: helix-turn-helix transcriptional regulator [Methylobacterium]